MEYKTISFTEKGPIDVYYDAEYRCCLFCFYGHVEKNGNYEDLIQRLYHLDRIDVVKGQSITKDTRVGLYGIQVSIQQVHTFT